jgi:hypothetical protein
MEIDRKIDFKFEKILMGNRFSVITYIFTRAVQLLLSKFKA